MSIGSGADLLQEERTALEVSSASGDVAALSPRALFWRRFRADRVAMTSAIVVIIFILIAILAPVIISVFGLHNPDAQNSQPARRLRTGDRSDLVADPFGVDDLGRDVLSRIIYGLRVSLEVGVHRVPRSLPSSALIVRPRRRLLRQAGSTPS